MKSVIAMAAAIAAMLILLGAQAKAAVLITMDQVGSNVVATGSGSIDLTDLSFLGSGSPVADVTPGDAYLVLGTCCAFFYGSGVTGPSSFGSGNSSFASSFTGLALGVQPDPFPPFENGETLIVPFEYVSGSTVTGTATWDNTTLAALGVMDGTYVWTWGTGPHADSLTLEIGSAVPEPSTWAMMILGFCGLGFMAYHRRRRPIALTAG